MTIRSVDTQTTGAGKVHHRKAKNEEGQSIQDNFSRSREQDPLLVNITKLAEIRFDQGPQKLSADQASILNSLGINASQVEAGKKPALVLGDDGRMSLQLLDSDSPVETSAPSPSPSFSSSGKPTWSAIEKTLRQWGDMKAVSDEQVSQVKGELGPLFKKSGIEFDNFRIKCDRDDPRGISAVSPDGWVHVEFQRNSSSCPSLMSFTLDELRNEWSSQKSGSAGEAAAPSKRRPMKEERAIEIARAAINSKGNMDIMPRSISDEDLKEAYGMLKNAKDGSVGTRSNQFYYGNDLMTIDQIRNLSKAIGMLLL